MSPDAAGTPRSAPGGVAPWLQLAALAGAFAALFAWTFGAWPDVVIDYGRELYVPWRMLEGEQLFRDLSWFNGPLSPHWNALVFRLFGVGLLPLVFVDAALFAATLALLHFVLRGFASPVGATLACLTVMAVCGFGQLLFIGNYNFICPYSHEATHGVLLGLAGLAAARRYGDGGAGAWLAASGAAVGLAFLTKPEMFAAAFAGGCAAVALYPWSLRRSSLGAMLVFTLGALLPVAASWALLQGALGSTGAWTATLGAWPQLAASDVSRQQFYLGSMGLDRPRAGLASMLTFGAAAAAVLAPGAALAFSARAARRPRLALTLAAAAAAALCALVYADSRWLQAPRPWPLFAGLALVQSARTAIKRRGDAAAAGAAAFAAFSLVMTGKMLLNARLYHYGFALALPATALVVVIAWDWLPARVEAAGGRASFLRAAVGAALACFVSVHLVQTARLHAGKSVEVGVGADRFLADARGRAVNEVLAWLEASYPAGAARPTVAVLPEGVTLNYLARLRNPTPYFNFMPPEIELFGEEEILAAFRASPPDLVLLVHKDTSEYGVRFFGRHYARALGAWLQENYRELERFGDPPLRPGSRFGIAVFGRDRSR